MTSETILLVDDEVNVLSSLSRTLYEEDYGEILNARNSLEALEIVKKTSGLNLVISDFHMPGMDGIELLMQIRALSPYTTRILLTGVADLEMALNAVNKGNVFRFLLKPCPTDVFIGAVKDGIRYNQLIVGERELLTDTLNGSIKVMIDILEEQNPMIFTQANRLRRLAHDLAIALHLDDISWEIELAALLSQIGAVTIPKETLFKQIKGLELNESEREMLASIPRMGRQLIKNIPRMEIVAEAVGNQNCTFIDRVDSESPMGLNIPIISRILKIIMDYDRFREITHSSVSAIQTMETRKSEYDPEILEVFSKKVIKINEQLSYRATKAKLGEKQIYVDDLKVGMVLSRDITDKKGILIVTKYTIITEVLIYKLINYFRSQSIVTPVFIEVDL
jgi:response regulator RpfG family c-di-GMP phosphodiesterase